MSRLRERYQRYRRFGLAPLTKDATEAQRDAHIAELAKLRRQRRRKLALRSGLGTLALVVLASVLLYWLVMTVGGRNVLLAQIKARLPMGTQLSWRSAEGPAAGPLILHGVHFSMPRQRDPDCKPTQQASCAMGTIVFDADKVMLDPALRPLLGRRLRLDALEVTGATLNLPRSDTPFELPRWPDVLPQIEPPLALRADDIVINGFSVTQEGEPLIAISRARGGLDAQSGKLHVEHFRFDSDRGRFALHGDYAPRDNFRSDITASAVLPASAGRTPARLGLFARGDLSRMDVAIGGNAPEPLHATLTLRGKDAPRWQLRANSTALDIGLLTGSASTFPSASAPIAFKLRGDGVAGDANLQGTFKQGNFSATLRPSKLSLGEQVLRVHPLVIDALDGRISANGSADLHDPKNSSLKFAVNARGLRWRGSTDAVEIAGNADFGIAGTLEKWVAIGNARLQRDGKRATVDFDGLGNREGVRLRKLDAVMPGGRLDATGNLAWSPALRWDADARLAGFDPGYFLPDWSGAVNGTITTSGEFRDSGALLADIDAKQLGGTLRGRPLSGRGSLHIDGSTYAGDVVLALGQSRVTAKGRMASNIELDANFAPLQLNDLLPDGNGSVRGSLHLRGARTAPDVDVDLVGDALGYGNYRAQHLVAKGKLPWRNGNGLLLVDASGLALGLPLDSLRIHARGAVERLQLEGSAKGDIGTLALTGSANKQGTRWQGALASLRLALDKGATWALQDTARWSWDGSNGSLSSSCLAADSGGTLCADADWPRRGLDVQGNGLPLALLKPYLPDRSDGRPWYLSGEVALIAHLQPAGNAWRGNLSLTSANGGVRNTARAKRDLVGYRDLKLDATFNPQKIEANLAAGLNTKGHIDAHIVTGWDDYAPLDGTLRLDTDELTWLELFSPDIVQPTGKLDVDVRLSGTRGKPVIGGEGHLTQFATELPALGIAIQDGDVRLQAQPDGTARIIGKLRSGHGTLDVDGTLDWRDQSTPLVLNLRGKDVLVAETRQLRAVAAPDISVRYAAGKPLQVTGKVTISEADINLERLDQGVSTSPDVVVLDPVDPNHDAPNALDLDLELVMGDAVNLKGFGLTGTLGGSLRVRAPPGREMRATGELNVGGRYRAYGQRLQITRGRLLWANNLVGDPRLDIRAERVVGDVTAGIRVEGNASDPRASVYSDPAKSETEALSYLTLGRPLTSLSGAEAQQLGSAKSALSAGTGLLASELGSRIGLDDAGVSNSRALGGDVLSVGKYLSPKLYVGFGVSLLGTGQVLTLKYLLRKGFNIQIESSTVENRASVNYRKEK
ncbi:translocation/assembly module TamB domain-containing protein [Thermomonas sp.]|uniref:translocation/assembly module TamB domain-containing protein n=1 Tax=Thermomonas sp. TaxID=1971895 RepID=UPI0024878BAF|nr:translocation/assembly module TamB domain-containing protein [Thermomonas sp.]MDI1252328.1 translocation/assembly module TamB domain-containing protein [Thermomonas sp.]